VSDDDFLRRWSRRKIEARKGMQAEEPAKVEEPAQVEEAAKPAPPPADVASAEPPPLPSVESLTPDSDFAAFMQPKVDGTLRNQALKTLFKDPRFNVMDGLDVYIDDYSKPDPLPEGWLEKMSQVARLGAFEPPREEPGEVPAAEEAEAGEPDAAPSEAQDDSSEDVKPNS
jgi:hypothetical protein